MILLHSGVINDDDDDDDDDDDEDDYCSIHYIFWADLFCCHLPPPGIDAPEENDWTR